MSNANNFPKLHNATWPGVVGKGVPGAEPFLSLVEMLDLTKGAEVDGVKFDGFDLFLAPPHFDCDKMDAEVEQIVKYCSDYGFDVGSFVANVWAGSAMGDESARATFLAEVDRACQVGQKLRKAGVRPYGCVRIDSSCSVDAWSKDPDANSKTIVDTFKKACDVAEKYGETLAMEGEVCWGGMHSWKRCLQVLESVDRPGVLGLQADMSHTNLFLLGANAPEDRLLPEDFQWGQTEVYDEAYKIMTDALRPWLVDFHVAQNDGTVFGSGAHDKTGRHCLPKDPNGKLDIPKYAKFWLTENGAPTKKLNCICWDGCMFPNAAMKDPQTWNDVLGAMVEVRAACGWTA
ncbi:MAG: TIM barrel protein [Thermoguttaceae bacterium]|nr:TIM barrel protein [Thermoguttaceae bacterium]MBR5759756.1 TIM barrel protein [Thermoguttaceae bacterium]